MGIKVGMSPGRCHMCIFQQLLFNMHFLSLACLLVGLTLAQAAPNQRKYPFDDAPIEESRREQKAQTCLDGVQQAQETCNKTNTACPDGYICHNEAVCCRNGCPSSCTKEEFAFQILKGSTTTGCKTFCQCEKAFNKPAIKYKWAEKQCPSGTSWDETISGCNKDKDVNKICNDSNDCIDSPCMNGGTCTDLENAYTCTCRAGYTGEDCEKNIVDCKSSPCEDGFRCINKVNGYSCTQTWCQAGFDGENCDIDIDECESSPCQNGGQCKDKVNGYTCTCVDGYTGEHCETDIDECESSPCQNGGQCKDKVNGYTCTCVDGYTGEHCETDIDECVTSPCKNGGTCINSFNGYSCRCAGGFTGENNCEIDIDECESSPCQNGGQCNDEVDKYTCTCRAGFTGKNCEKDIDDCKPNPCENGGTCSDKVNDYTCTCKDGYTGNNCETDINECESSPACQNGATCNNEVNKYTCTCKPGYTGDNCEEDIDDCTLSPCENGGTCTDKVNDYMCTCKDGYTGKNCETDIDECESSPCQNGGWCKDEVDKYIYIDDCKPFPCKNGGTCSDKVNDYTCTCKDGYTGKNCETDIDECKTCPCKNGGTCKNKVNGHTCTCAYGFTGEHCEIVMCPDLYDCTSRAFFGHPLGHAIFKPAIGTCTKYCKCAPATRDTYHWVVMPCPITTRWNDELKTCAHANTVECIAAEQLNRNSSGNMLSSNGNRTSVNRGMAGGPALHNKQRVTPQEEPLDGNYNRRTLSEKDEFRD